MIDRSENRPIKTREFSIIRSPRCLAVHKSAGSSASNDLRMTSGLVTFSLFEAASYSEIIPAGINSVVRGQINAAFVLGLNYPQAMR